MPNVSVLIPTANRPQYLPKALASVAQQSAKQHIAEVLVMENGGNRQSEAICKSFPELPIRYVFREKRIPIGGLLESWFNEAQAPIVALMHDDDWWTEDHLDRGLTALKNHPQAGAFYNSCNRVLDETGWILSLYGSFIAWFGNPTAPAGGIRPLSFEQTLLCSLLATGFHMSALIAPKSALDLAMPFFNDGNAFDYDRSLAVGLAQQGGLLFDDTPSAFVRVHPGQDSAVAGVSERERTWFPQNTRRLLKLADEQAIDVRTKLPQRLDQLGLNLYSLAEHCTELSLETLYAESLLPKSMIAAYHQRKRNQKIRAMLRRATSILRKKSN